MSEPTKAATNAGQKLWPVAATLSATEISEFIDRETGLPELVAALKRCREACEQAGMMGAVMHADIALRKAGEL